MRGALTKCLHERSRMRQGVCKDVAMPNIDEEAKSWQLEQAGRVGTAVARRRARLGMTAVDLAERTRELGYPITRVAISKIENNARAGKIDISEITVLAAALGVPPILLMYPDLPSGVVRALPAIEEVESYKALRWFIGDSSLGEPHTPEDGRQLVERIREYAPVRRDWAIATVRSLGQAAGSQEATALKDVQQLLNQLEEAIQELRKSVFDE